MGMMRAQLEWLLESDEPWTRFHALLELDGRRQDDPDVVATRAEMAVAEPVRELVALAGEWPGYPLKRHNDAAHPIYAIATLADFGLDRSDPGIEAIADALLEHFDGEAFESLLWLPRFLTKDAEDSERWAWMLCDAPTLLHALLAFGYGHDRRVLRAVETLAQRVHSNGWRCGAASSLPSFGGPGRKHDACPIATTAALKALAHTPLRDDPGLVGPGIGVLLDHWEHQRDYKLKMFGIGTEFRRLKYPFVWYDILHVADVLSQFPGALADPRFGEMVEAISVQADDQGRHTAGSMYRAWRDWSFADKKRPSPWLTLLALRIQARMASRDR